MTISPSDSFTSTPIPVSPMTVPPGGSRAHAAAQRREAALARLTARRMPLPGLPATPPPPVTAAPRAATAPTTTSRRPHIHLVTPPSRVPTPPAPGPGAPAPTQVRVVPTVPAARAPRIDIGVRPRPDLTQREIQVLRTWLLTDSKIAVAHELSISIGTVNTHLTRIRAKYTAVERTARTKAALAARAIQDGILSLDDL